MSSSFKFEVQQAPCVSCTEKKHRIWGLVCILLVGQFTIPLNAQRSLSVWPTARGESSFPSHSSSAVGLPGLPVGLSSPPRQLLPVVVNIEHPLAKFGFYGDVDDPMVIMDLLTKQFGPGKPLEPEQVFTKRNIAIGIGIVTGLTIAVGAILKLTRDFLVSRMGPVPLLSFSFISNLGTALGGLVGFFYTTESGMVPQMGYLTMTFISSLMMISSIVSFKNAIVSASKRGNHQSTSGSINTLSGKTDTSPPTYNDAVQNFAEYRILPRVVHSIQERDSSELQQIPRTTDSRKKNTNDIRKSGDTDELQQLTETPNTVAEELAPTYDTLGSEKRQDPIGNGAVGEALPNSEFGYIQRKIIDPTGNGDESLPNFDVPAAKKNHQIVSGNVPNSKFGSTAGKIIDPIGNGAVGDSDQGSVDKP
eukprot:GHVS01083658.1.p1 GENE.GHVS01083658.1~~GHVS01083658.1.p1  ORF type:complete len:420 (-),score=32.16 GHVS01083658.1:499-1758(-)